MFLLLKVKRNHFFDAHKLFKKGELRDWYFFLHQPYYVGLFVKNCSFKNLHKKSLFLETDLIDFLNAKGAIVNIQWLKKFYKIYKVILAILDFSLFPLYYFIKDIIMFIPRELSYNQFNKDIFDRMRQNKSDPFIISNHKKKSSIMDSPVGTKFSFTGKMIEEYNLIVFNDDDNTFVDFILNFVSICNLTTEQARQSALIINNKGKLAIKTGEIEILKPMLKELLQVGLKAEIEPLAKDS